MTNKILKKVTLENLLCLFIIICPILDSASFLFRNYFNTSLSISTIIRPIIPIIVITYIFIKDRIKTPLIFAGITYILYGIIHIYIFKSLQTESAYGNISRELQYIINYTFMIMNLFTYLYVFMFRKKCEENNINKLKKAMLVSFTIYVILMFVAIISGTSSHTYVEDKMGYKGWFESGNTIGAIMIITLFILLPMVKKENIVKTNLWLGIVILFSIIYMTILLGTRIGLFGTIIVFVVYIICKIVYELLHNKKISKIALGIVVSTFSLIVILIVFLGSTTLSRRKLLKNREDDIYDNMQQEVSHVTGDILNLVNKIKNNEIQEKYMSKSTQQAIIDLYNFNTEHKVPYTNMRLTQLIYHMSLIKEQKSILLILFGNGYMNHYYELIFEMEVPAFLFNFGIYGFVIFFMPFFIVTVYAVIFGIKNIRKLNLELIMEILALCFSIVVSFLSGYTFFNQSVATIITAICVITLYQIIKMKGEKSEKNSIWNNQLNTWRSGKSISRHSKQTSGKV